MKPCSRCKVVTVDQGKGEVPDGKEPLAALKKIHSGKVAGYQRKAWDRVPFFGWNCVTAEEMVGRVVCVGEEVRVLGHR